MELDTGASLSVMGETTFLSLLGNTVPSEPTEVRLCTYTGDRLPVLGEATVTVTYESQSVTLPLIIVQGQGAALFGRNWLYHIRLNWAAIHMLSNHSPALHKVLHKHHIFFVMIWVQYKEPQQLLMSHHSPSPRFTKLGLFPMLSRKRLRRNWRAYKLQESYLQFNSLTGLLCC